MSLRITQEKITQAGAEAVAYVTAPAYAYDPGQKEQADSWLTKLRAMFGPGETKKPAVVVTAGPENGGARCILHAFCPPWRGGMQGEWEALSQCYRDLLLITKQKGCQSIALPLISFSEFGFPKDLAMGIARDEISAFLEDNDLDVILCVRDRDDIVFPEIRQADLEEYIGEKAYGAAARPNQAGGVIQPEEAAPPELMQFKSKRCESKQRKSKQLESRRPEEAKPSEPKRHDDTNLHASVYYESAMYETFEDSGASEDYLRDIIAHTEDTFQQCLLHKIDERGLTDPDVYKRANIDRKHFSKIRSNTNYNPTKKTALALSISLKLDLVETQDLLERAGLALSPSSKADLIVKYCIMNRIYNIFEVNALLFKYGQQTLG